ncbi:rCG34689 [Rattus norvegicus]|uniref:RCG34689 n=1 Tax=Rattus norvegicus TaxID=10116 RepID=A6HK97_RAT|nr:rCG34689 [Rattus norvegicus]
MDCSNEQADLSRTPPRGESGNKPISVLISEKLRHGQVAEV